MWARFSTTLDELKLTDQTLIIFSSDNGATPKDFKGTQNATLNLASEAGDVRAKYKTAKADAKSMGHVTNGQWHDGKGSPFEGGHRVPFIARWPGRIAPASTSDHTFCLTDMLATAADLLKVKLPDNAAEDSMSILPVMLGEPTSTNRKAIFVQGDTQDNAIAVCSGQWKMIETANGKKEKTHQLYDLIKDAGETTDVAKENPDIVKQLEADPRQSPHRRAHALLTAFRLQPRNTTLCSSPTMKWLFLLFPHRLFCRKCGGASEHHLPVLR